MSLKDTLYPSRASAGAELGRQLYGSVTQPVVVFGITPGGVEIAHNVAEALGAKFDVIVAADVDVEDEGVVGAIAENGDAFLDPDFEPGFGMLDSLNEGIDQAHRTIKTDQILFRGQRSMQSISGVDAVIVDGHATTPWRLLAAGMWVQKQSPAHVIMASPVGTLPVQERLRARRFQFVCPTIVMDPSGHPRPFGDPQDPQAVRLRSIVLARDAA